jgi:hypothetical protein
MRRCCEIGEENRRLIDGRGHMAGRRIRTKALIALVAGRLRAAVNSATLQFETVAGADHELEYAMRGGNQIGH